MTDLKREYVIPLRRKTRTAPKWRRSKKAVTVLKEYVKKHMKTDTVILCPELNEKIWENGIKNPPGKVSVIALKTTLGNDEKTLVNLAEIGVDEQLKAYQQVTPVAASGKTEDKKNADEKVVDAEVKEKEDLETKVDAKEEKKEKAETKVEKKTEDKKEDKK